MPVNPLFFLTPVFVVFLLLFPLLDFSPFSLLFIFYPYLLRRLGPCDLKNNRPLSYTVVQSINDCFCTPQRLFRPLILVPFGIYAALDYLAKLSLYLLY